MNVVFLSPSFPPTAPAFCVALAKQGLTVLGIGDQELRPELREAYGLTHYVYEPRMAEHQPLREAWFVNPKPAPVPRTRSRSSMMLTSNRYWNAS